jgi:hypothetical protein
LFRDVSGVTLATADSLVVSLVCRVTANRVIDRCDAVDNVLTTEVSGADGA